MNLIIIEDDKGYENLKRSWKAYKQDLDCGRAKLGDRSTIYYYQHENENGEFVWDIYNFVTYSHETVVGDIGGLCGASRENFPFLMSM